MSECRNSLQCAIRREFQPRRCAKCAKRNSSFVLHCKPSKSLRFAKMFTTDGSVGTDDDNAKAECRIFIREIREIRSSIPLVAAGRFVPSAPFGGQSAIRNGHNGRASGTRKCLAAPFSAGVVSALCADFEPRLDFTPNQGTPKTLDGWHIKASNDATLKLRSYENMSKNIWIRVRRDRFCAVVSTGGCSGGAGSLLAARKTIAAACAEPREVCRLWSDSQARTAWIWRFRCRCATGNNWPGEHQQIYDPVSPDFHNYLTPEQFTGNIAPTEEDYEALTTFAKNSGFEVMRHAS